MKRIAKMKQPHPEPENKIYRIFESNLHKLAYFLGTTEGWYEEQVRILAKQVRKARKELSQVEIKLDKLSEKMDRSELSEVEQKQMDKLEDKAYELTDVDIFVPTEAKLFRQFTELIRVLGLSYLVTIFESYIADIVREILLTHPNILKSAKQFTAETVLDLGGRKQIVRYLAEKEIEELLYKSFPDIVNYFNRKFNINLSDSGVSVERIVEIMATRNIHVHNGGIVNRRYLESVKESKLKVGAYKSITSGYLKISFDLIIALVKFIDAEVQRKYFAGQES